MNTKSPAPLVEVTRGDVVERVHYGHAVVLTEKNQIAFSLGNPYKFTYMRSCAKPVQAIPLVRSGACEHFAFSQKELAVMCASHYAEDVHMETLTGILAKIGLTENDLLCGSATSLKYDHALELARRGEGFRQLFNDCSGKHLGMLAYCRFRGYPIENYISPDHPAQQDIIAAFADFCQYPQQEISIGIDGCSAPVFALPLYNMALAYLKLSNPQLFDTPYSDQCNRIFSAMTAHPEMIAGTGGFCTELTRGTNGKLIGKVGAEGVYCVGVKDAGLSLAVKIEDGSMAVLSTIVIELLNRFGVLSDSEKESLAHLRYKDNLNDRGIVVGVQRPAI